MPLKTPPLNRTTNAYFLLYWLAYKHSLARIIVNYPLSIVNYSVPVVYAPRTAYGSFNRSVHVQGNIAGAADGHFGFFTF